MASQLGPTAPGYVQGTSAMYTEMQDENRAAWDAVIKAMGGEEEVTELMERKARWMVDNLRWNAEGVVVLPDEGAPAGTRT
ncbi:MAG: hypothetical protein M3P01_11200 [Actinomycetota bacterium]|nr:hypothetical protein [Actinomycetota bacterium]